MTKKLIEKVWVVAHVDCGVIVNIEAFKCENLANDRSRKLAETINVMDEDIVVYECDILDYLPIQ